VKLLLRIFQYFPFQMEINLLSCYLGVEKTKESVKSFVSSNPSLTSMFSALRTLLNTIISSKADSKEIPTLSLSPSMSLLERACVDSAWECYSALFIHLPPYNSPKLKSKESFFSELGELVRIGNVFIFYFSLFNKLQQKEKAVGDWFACSVYLILGCDAKQTQKLLHLLLEFPSGEQRDILSDVWPALSQSGEVCLL